MTMPEKLQPGPLAGQISYFAPVSLFFFFFLMFIISTLRNLDLHPLNYFFLACAFFAFHLLLAYLVDHISIHAAMVIASLVSVALVVSYLRLVVGIRFAAFEAGTAQVIYLVLFFVRVLLEGIHWALDHGHINRHIVRRYAGHGTDSLVRAAEEPGGGRTCPGQCLTCDATRQRRGTCFPTIGKAGFSLRSMIIGAGRLCKPER